MKEYYFQNGEFVIENYDKQRTFTSFLPAIAGKKGIPLWAFYVNRGQIMSSFGVKDKNGAILEFFPAYTAYEVIERIGFRTFVRINNKTHEIFSNAENLKVVRKMRIKREQVTIEEVNYSLNIKVEVTYFTLPNENVASLIRKVKVTNLSSSDMDIEVLDGLTQIFTPGTEHGVYKVMSNLQRSWMEVKGLNETNTAYYKMSSSTSDSAEVKEVTIGNFYMSMVDGMKVKPIVDPVAIFGYDTSYARPVNFIKNDIDTIVSGPSYAANKVYCGFTPAKLHLEGKQEARIDTFIGQIYSYDAYLSMIDKMLDVSYVDKKQQENTDIIDEMTKTVKTDTANKLFNEYIESTFLDNMLRGGYPFVFKDNNGKDNIYYLFSRKHGDPERDYNWFNIENEFYSQGNGNFRDICQNRRNDSMLSVAVKDYNLKYFMDLMQLDGYNPLGVNCATFQLNDHVDVNKVVEENFDDPNGVMKNLLSNKFTPGSIVNTAVNNNIHCKVDENTYLANILTDSHWNVEATFGEGYWCDHFTYVLDLYESFMSVYPDKDKETLFDDCTYTYFEPNCFVQPRYAKTCLTPSGKVRQYGALLRDDDLKIKTFNLNGNITNWAKTSSKEVIQTNLASKFFQLAFMKFNLLDNQGIGIEMEGGKPGWNDACNGLSGLFGSAVGETFEVLRIVKMLQDVCKKYPNESMYLPVEFMNLVKANIALLNQNLSDYDYWDKSSSLREEYREVLRVGVSKNVEVKMGSMKSILNKMEAKLNSAVDKAKAIGNGILPTFITYEVTKYEKYLDENGNVKTGYNGYQLVKALEFKRKDIPNFLEAPARSMKILKDKTYLRNMYKAIKISDIYDEKLHMYKTSGALDAESMEIGRIRAFTKGWLERESNFMHMTYKYMYGLLKAGLYTEFFNEIKTNMVCNMNPKVYGRSPLEHSSFIATSNNPDKDIHGQGFVSRLSGSTAEMLSLYLTMMTGGHIFEMTNDGLSLALKPILTKQYFKEDHTLSFTLLGKIKVTYVNKDNIDTYKGKISKYVLKNDNEEKTLDQVVGQDAIDVRNLKYKEIIAYVTK